MKNANLIKKSLCCSKNKVESEALRNQEEKRKQYYISQCKSVSNPYFNTVFSRTYQTGELGHYALILQQALYNEGISCTLAPQHTHRHTLQRSVPRFIESLFIKMMIHMSICSAEKSFGSFWLLSKNLELR